MSEKIRHGGQVDLSDFVQIWHMNYPWANTNHGRGNFSTTSRHLRTSIPPPQKKGREITNILHATEARTTLHKCKQKLNRCYLSVPLPLLSSSIRSLSLSLLLASGQGRYSDTYFSQVKNSQFPRSPPDSKSASIGTGQAACGSGTCPLPPKL